MTRDMSKLKKNSRDDKPGRFPDTLPEYTPVLANAWFEKYRGADEGFKEYAVPEAGNYRASWAGSCLRALQYKMTTTPETDPTSVADAWRMQIGTNVHDMIQGVIEDAFPGAEREVKVDLRIIGLPGSAHLDLLIEEDGIRTAVEIKSINGFGYKMSATNFNGPPEGPRESAVIQGALAAAALECDRLKVIYYSLELLSPSVAAKAGLAGELGRFSAEWTYTKDEFLPIVAAEIAHVTEVQASIGEELMVRRWAPGMPEEGEISNPATGAWVVTDGSGYVSRTGDYWGCNYCGHQTRCMTDGEGT